MPSELGPAYQRIARRLEEEITGGHWRPGKKVASEREIARTERVSLMTARRALMQLETLGLVTRRVGAGTFVAPNWPSARRLRDPHEEFEAPHCRLVPDGDGWMRQWWDGQVPVVDETIRLSGAGNPGLLPLLEFLGGKVRSAVEEVWAESGLLRVRQTLYGPEMEIVGVREMSVRGRRRKALVIR